MKVRKISIAKQILFILLIVSFIGVALIGVITYRGNVSMTFKQVQERAKDLAQLAAATVDAEAFEQIYEGSETFSYNYDRVDETLSIVKDNSSLEYVYSFRLDENGEPYFVVDTDHSEGATYGEAYEMDETMEKAFAGENSVDSSATSDEWGTYISAYAPIMKGTKIVGIVGVDVDYSDVQAKLNDARITIFGICAIVLVILFVAVFIVSKRVSNNLRRLNNKVSELADGSGNINKRLEIKSGDELEVIAEGINQFIDNVKGLAVQVASSSTENSGTVVEMNSDVMELSANMQECSATSESVSAHLAQVAIEMERLANEVAHVDEIAQQANESAIRSEKVAVEHKAEALERIDEISKGINSALKEADSINKVNDITEQINEIALQTKILSLNAQIEAARAGIYGTGFAVVATEIADLAAETADAVNEIADINSNVQTAMKHLRMYVERIGLFMTEQVTEDYNSFEMLGHEYGESTSDISGSMGTLAVQSKEMSELISGINASLNDISRAVADSAKQVESVSSSTNEIANSMQELMTMPLIEMTKGNS